MIAFASLGTNLGNRLETLERAILKINGLQKTRVVLQSSIYETEPVGGPVQPRFLNSIVQILTGLSAQELLREFLLIEKKEGRVRSVLNAPRTLDIDLLFFGLEVIEEKEIVVPHPRLHLRKFVLIPLAEIAPQWIHPVFKKTIHELLNENESSESVIKMNDNFPEVARGR